MNDEPFGLSWPGKGQARRLAEQPPTSTLCPVPGAGVDEATTRNCFIEGDNLEVLKLLRKEYAGSVKLLYLDPPYNTGRDLVYKDSFAGPPKSPGRLHAAWLSMIYPRLLVAHELLRDDGVCVISIDDHEVHHLRLLMDEVFGEEHFVACIANVNNPKGRSDDKYIATAHEHLLIYRRTAALRLGGWAPGPRITRRYTRRDVRGRPYRELDLRKTGDGDRREDRPNLFYAFYYNPLTEELEASTDDGERPGFVRIVPVRADGSLGRWRWGLSTAIARRDRLVARRLPRRKVWSVFERDYLEDGERIRPTSVWTQRELNSERGSEQLVALGFAKEVFPRPKPVGLLRLLLELATEPTGAQLVLDPFAGSATLAQAVYESNRADGGDRRYLCVQSPEATPSGSAAYQAGFPTGAAIGLERIRRVLACLRAEAERRTGEDLGVRVYRLCETLSHE